MLRTAFIGFRLIIGSSAAKGGSRSTYPEPVGHHDPCFLASGSKHCNFRLNYSVYKGLKFGDSEHT